MVSSFVAIPLGHHKTALDGLIESYPGLLKASTHHLTLGLLNPVGVSETHYFLEEVRKCDGRIFPLQLKDIVAMPSTHAPEVVAVTAVESEQLRALRNQFEGDFVKIMFVPHITLHRKEFLKSGFNMSCQTIGIAGLDLEARAIGVYERQGFQQYTPIVVKELRA